MTDVVIIIGSESDRKMLEESKMLDFLTEVKVSWKLSIISAHRNSDFLRDYCLQQYREGTFVFIGIAGMAAALPGAIAAALAECAGATIIGVPLVSEIFDGLDALLAMIRMPSGIPVVVPGIGKSGLYNAAIVASQIVGQTDSDVRNTLALVLKAKKKSPQLDILSSSSPG